MRQSPKSEESLCISAALVDFPCCGSHFYISIMQRIKREPEFLSEAKKGSRA
jgi:hypothetical protein